MIKLVFWYHDHRGLTNLLHLALCHHAVPLHIVIPKIPIRYEVEVVVIGPKGHIECALTVISAASCPINTQRFPLVGQCHH